MAITELTDALAVEHKILACVHCGLCLEACPTYTLTGNENDSPRGRIYLMRAVVEGKLAGNSATFQTHIDRCLGCRACEPVCPAGVEYGQLLEVSRESLFKPDVPRGVSYRLLRLALRHVWLHPARLRFAFSSARLMRDLGMAKPLRMLVGTLSSRMQFGLALLESSAPQLDVDAPTAASPEAEAGASSRSNGTNLFTGCVTAGLFARVNEATRRVLRVNGYSVRSPKGQVCCGALHAHAGDLEGARILARQNIQAFEAAGNDPIITNAGGCGAMLVSYGHLFAGDPSFATRAKKFGARVRDISQQLEGLEIKKGAPLAATPVTYDASCHLLNGQHAAEAPLKLLRAIPDLNIVPLEGAERCCGGAGVYNLLEPAMSAGVLEEKLRHVRETGAEILATGNGGCQMQIGAGARLSGLDLKVCHPIELLDESYRLGGLY
ncbi:MAG: heterodisulfide reductase-related iron-sulfur binding cluster [bacterium]